MTEAPTTATEAGAEEFYYGFESLGANCEFGLVQRRFGAEPLGLLRWPTITVEGLIACLKSDFSDLCDISNLSLIPGPNDDWDVQTPNFSLHLYAKIGSVDEETLLKTAFRRIQFMRRNLLESLEEGEKIFVFKEWQFRMSDADIAGMDAALKRHNAKNQMLAVRLDSSGVKAGSVARVSDELWLGYVELDAKVSAAKNVPFGSWDRICRAVRPNC